MKVVWNIILFNSEYIELILFSTDTRQYQARDKYLTTGFRNSGNPAIRAYQISRRITSFYSVGNLVDYPKKCNKLQPCTQGIDKVSVGVSLF